MRLSDIGKNLHDEKKVLRNGFILLGFAGLLILLILRFDAVWGAASTVFATLIPVLCGLVIAYILNVFVHFFEDIVFKPFQKSQSKVWKKMKRPLSVSLAYVVSCWWCCSSPASSFPGSSNPWGSWRKRPKRPCRAT